ncbi:MAG: Hsp20/alpha crystallin family protein, partial [Sulfurimicrobium sp.]|nr:Hsp20/alpha crystallin family protein [Sulfurimicrobium sp.]
MAKNDKPQAAVAKQESKEVEKSQPSTAISPAGEMERVFDRVRDLERRMFDSFFRRDWLSPLRWEEPAFPELGELFKLGGPKVDVVERDTEVLVRAEVPGVAKDDLDISLTENTVTLRGKTRHEEKEEKGDYRRM